MLAPLGHSVVPRNMTAPATRHYSSKRIIPALRQTRLMVQFHCFPTDVPLALAAQDPVYALLAKAPTALEG